MPQSPEPAAEKRRAPINWKAVFRSQEVDILFAGLFCILTLLVWFLCLQYADGPKARRMLVVVTTHVSAGRAAGVATAAAHNHFSQLETIVLGSLIEGAVVCLFFAAFCLSCKKLIRLPWLDSAIRNVQVSAREQRHRLLGWGIPGLIAFVWFPFLMTGPVVGSVIGYLLGMRPWMVVSVVMFGTVSAIVSWTFLMHMLNGWMQSVNPLVPTVFVVIILGIVLTTRLRKLRRSGGAAAGTGTLPTPQEPGPGPAPNQTDSDGSDK